MEPEHDNTGRHAIHENRISVHATKTITDAEANFEEAWKREVLLYHKEVKQRVRRLDIAIIYATVCCLATFLSLRLDRCLGFIGPCNDIRAGSDVELIETWCLVVFLSIISIASVTRWSQGTPTHSISSELRSQIEQLSPKSADRGASWMDKIVRFVPYPSFLLFLYEVLDNLPLNTPTFSMNVFWSVSTLTIFLALPNPRRQPPVTTHESNQGQALSPSSAADQTTPARHARTHSNGEPITDLNAREPLFMSVLRQEQSSLRAEKIKWILDRHTDDDTTVAALRAILRMAWRSGNHSLLLKRCYEILLQSFEIVDDHPALIQRLRNLAYLSARAFCHILVQSGSDAQGPEDKVMNSLKKGHTPLSLGCREGDSNLQSVIGLTDRLLGVDQEIEWSSFQLSSAHHLWLSDILLYHASNLVAAGKQEKVHGEVATFVQDTFSLEPPSALSIDTNCVLMVGLLVDIPVHRDDLLVSGEKKSSRFTPITERLFVRLNSIILNQASTESEVGGALDALRCIGFLTYNIIPQACFDLFTTIMTAASHLPVDMRWEISRQAMHGAFKWDGYYPMISSPHEVLSFLEYHFDLQSRGENQDEAIQYAVRALAFSPSQACLEILAQFDPTAQPFFNGIRSLFHSDKPHELKKAAIRFLSHIEARWFPVFAEHVPPDAVRDFSEDLISSIDEIFTDELEVKKAGTILLLSMADASTFRLHIPLHMWEHLEFVHELREGSPPLQRCRDNRDVIPALKRIQGQKPLLLWLAILWREITRLDPRIQEQVVDATASAMTQSPHAEDFLLLLLNAEEVRLEEKLRPFSPWSTDQEVEALRLRLYELRESRSHFYEVCEPEEVS